MMDRRGFLSAILAAGMAPAIVKAANLMPVRQLSSGLLVPDIQRALAGGPVLQLFSGHAPLTADDAVRGATLLVTVALGKDVAKMGTLEMRGNGVAAATGTATFARIDMGGGRVIQMPIGFGDGAFVLANRDFVPGMPLSAQMNLSVGSTYQRSPLMSQSLVESMLLDPTAAE